uniref:Target of myb1 like 2 membrane trafficking protein n=1 Tax=Sinocyclocheilus grahami TaxID=75366 RepID=A0A672Q2Q2_SINGR
MGVTHGRGLSVYCLIDLVVGYVDKMEFLLGNPYSTPVGQCIERATDGSLQSEDWTLNMEICDIINETEDGPKDAIRAVKKRLNGNKNYREVMLTLTRTGQVKFVLCIFVCHSNII